MTTEATPDQQREVLEALFAKRFPDHYMPGRSGIGPSRWAKFTAMLDCGAFVDAALMLVPEGCGYTIKAGSDEMPYLLDHKTQPVVARVFFLSKGIDAIKVAATPALALCAAIASIER